MKTEDRSFEYLPPTAGKNSHMWMRKWIAKQIMRRPAQSLLSLFTAAAFLLGLCFLNGSIISNNRQIDHLYESLIVEGMVMQKNATFILGGGFFPAKSAKEMESEGMFLEVSKTIGGAVSGKSLADGAVKVNNLFYRAYFSPGGYVDISGRPVEITYTEDGMDGEVFFSESQEEGCAILSTSWFRYLGISPGDKVVFYFNNFAKQFRVVGYYRYSEFSKTADVILNGHVLESAFSKYDEPYCYSEYRFIINPDKNRDVAAFRIFSEDLIARSAAPTPLIFIMKDAELIQAVEPLERSSSILGILYPFVQALAVIAAGLISGLMVIRGRVDMAIMRVLGVSRKRLVALVSVCQFIPVVPGFCAGFVVSSIIVKEPIVPILMVAEIALYSAGCLGGAVFAAYVITKKNPLELLQVKE